jgi:hypothetical protein
MYFYISTFVSFNSVVVQVTKRKREVTSIDDCLT